MDRAKQIVWAANQQVCHTFKLVLSLFIYFISLSQLSIYYLTYFNLSMLSLMVFFNNVFPNINCDIAFGIFQLIINLNVPLIWSCIFCRLVGDVLLATGFLSYSGPFNQEFRDLLLNNWKKEMRKTKIPFSEVCLVYLQCILSHLRSQIAIHFDFNILNTFLKWEEDVFSRLVWIFFLRSKFFAESRDKRIRVFSRVQLFRVRIHTLGVVIFHT